MQLDGIENYTSGEPLRVSVLMPVYNDWTAAAMVTRSLAREFQSRCEIRASLLIVDDGSTEADQGAPFAEFTSFENATILRLNRNLGHQPAIAIGLSWLRENRESSAVLVMDGDGEDRPEDALQLIDKFVESGQETAVFAARRRRTEGGLFWLGYHAYRIVHWILTGIAVEIGNYSVLPTRALETLTASRDLWSHYAASAIKLRIPMIKLAADRGFRVAGKTKMNYASLTRHGLSALSLYGAVVRTRLFISAGVAALAVLIFLFMAPVTAALIATGLLVVLLPLLFWTAIALTGSSIRGRFPFRPAERYRQFVESATVIHGKRNTRVYRAAEL